MSPEQLSALASLLLAAGQAGLGYLLARVHKRIKRSEGAMWVPLDPDQIALISAWSPGPAGGADVLIWGPEDDHRNEHWVM